MISQKNHDLVVHDKIAILFLCNIPVRPDFETDYGCSDDFSDTLLPKFHGTVYGKNVETWWIRRILSTAERGTAGTSDSSLVPSL